MSVFRRRYLRGKYLEPGNFQFGDYERWQRHADVMEKDCPGFFRRHPLGAIGRLDGGYQYGFEIEGYGTAIGPCTRHVHRYCEDAERCGAGWLALNGGEK